MHTEARPVSVPAAEYAAAAGVSLLLMLVVRAAMRDGERLRTLLVEAAAAARQTMTWPAAAAAVQVAGSLLALDRAQQHICAVKEEIQRLSKAGETVLCPALRSQICREILA